MTPEPWPPVDPDPDTLARIQDLIVRRIQTERAVSHFEPEHFGQLLHRQEFQMGLTGLDRLLLQGSGIRLEA